METEEPEAKQEKLTKNNSDSDWENRVLCSDGNCIGVIGPNGRCKECGKKYEGDLPDMSHSENEEQTTDTDADEESPSATVETESEEPDDTPSDDEWENRILCSDGNCIGVIGPDGKCKECGKSLK